MKKTKITTAIIFMLALTVLASEAFAGPGRGGRGRGGRQGLGRGMPSGPRIGANPEFVWPDNFRGPRGQYCPLCQRPIQNIRGWQGRGPGRFGQGFQGRGARGLAMQGNGRRSFQGRGPVMQGRGGRGFQGRGDVIQGRGFQRRNIAPQGRQMNGSRGQFRPEGMGRPGLGMQPRRFTPEDTSRPIPPRGRGWAPGSESAWRQGRAPGWGQGWGLNPQPEKAPDANAPEPPSVENQTDQP